jgi:hypothetical protein
VATLADLYRVIESTLATHRLGQPVYVRYLAQSLPQPEFIVPYLTRITKVVGGWLNQSLHHLYAVGTPASGQVALTLQFLGGASALIILASGPPGDADVDILVIGNHGTLAYEGGGADLWNLSRAASEPPIDPQIQHAIEQALELRKPVRIAAEAQP